MKPSIFENSDGGWAKSGEIVAASVGLAWMLVAFSAYPAHGWWHTIPGVGGSGDEANAAIPDAAGDVIAVGEISHNFAVIKFSGATGAELWRQEIDGTGGVYGDWDAAKAVAVDGSGDVIAAGYLYNSGTGADFAVIKFSGATGEELWRQEIDGTGTGTGAAYAVAVDGSGDVIAAGYLYNSGTGYDFTVIKFSGATGAELWRQEIDGSGSGGGDEAYAVAVDGSGDVIAAGYLYNSGTGADFAVIKFSGATGEELWRQEIDGTGGSGDASYAVAVDGSGDVIAAGLLYNSGTRLDFTVIKFSGATGEELWRQEIDGTGTYAYLADYEDEAQAVAVDGSGDVIAAGRLYNLGTGWALMVIKFSGATGAELWRQEIDGTDVAWDHGAQAVAVDGSGDVIAAGYLYNRSTHLDFTVIKFSGATGEELWRHEIDGTESSKDGAQAVAVDASGDVIAGGCLYNSDTGRDFTVIKFSGATGEFGGIRTGKSLVVKDNASGPERRQLKVLSKDPNWPVPAQGSADDPTLAGASVRLVNPYSAEKATFDLPPGPLWRVSSSVSGAVKYVYRDPSGINGPCNTLNAISGKRVRAICNGRTGLIPFTLDEPSQGALVVSVQFGGAEPQCAWFGGPVIKDQGTYNPGPNGIFRARDTQAVAATCPAPPSPSAAFLDVTTGVLD